MTAFSGDVVTAYCFAQGYGLLDRSDVTPGVRSDFAPKYYELWMSILSNSHLDVSLAQDLDATNTEYQDRPGRLLEGRRTTEYLRDVAGF
ncbi:MAG: hypothetical protein Q9180_000196 [Flavoplaca navasiana]